MRSELKWNKRINTRTGKQYHIFESSKSAFVFGIIFAVLGYWTIGIVLWPLAAYCFYYAWTEKNNKHRNLLSSFLVIIGTFVATLAIIFLPLYGNVQKEKESDRMSDLRIALGDACYEDPTITESIDCDCVILYLENKYESKLVEINEQYQASKALTEEQLEAFDSCRS